MKFFSFCSDIFSHFELSPTHNGFCLDTAAYGAIVRDKPKEQP